MPKRMYELGREIYCDEFEFFKTKWKVFDSESEARAYGLQEQADANDNRPPAEAASRGFGRLLKHLRVHGLITKTGKPYKYYLKFGRSVAALALNWTRQKQILARCAGF